MNAPDKTYNFALVLRGVSEPDHRVEDALFEAGCDDATLAVRNGVSYLEFDREAESLEQAILSAVRDVERADCELSVSHVEPDDLVTAAEIARRLGRSRESVRLLASGCRGNGGFPSPLSGVTGKTVLWSWARVVSWLATHNKLSDDTVLGDAETIRDMNTKLARPSRDPRADRVLVSEDTLTVDLSDGRTVSVPLAWYPRLSHGSPKERANWRLVADGAGLHWPDLDEEVSVEGILAGRSSAESQDSLQRWIEARKHAD